MKLDPRLELLTALATLAVGEQYESKEVDKKISSIIDLFELEEDSVPNIETKEIISLITLSVLGIQDMIEDYNALEREG